MQHLFLNRAPGPDWDPNRPETITDRLFQEPMEAMGTRGGSSLRLGLSFVFSVLGGPPERVFETLRRVLEMSERHGVPVLPVLDGQNWWEHRADLWNWWDRSRSGYDPANAANVEWIGPGEEHALRIAWRNWGRQIRVIPPPNLVSRRYREALRAELETGAGIVSRWMRGLPARRGWLCPGLKVGWEASIGINAYHYPGGNARWGQPESSDPTAGLDMAKDFAGGLAVQGYAARASEERRTSGPVTLADHERIVGGYLAFLAQRCRASGLRADQVFVHAGGQFAPWERHYTHATAVGRGAVPGWSLYGTDPQKAGDLAASLERAGRRDWCAAEWLAFASDAAGWERSLRTTLGFGACRFVSLYNWEGIRQNPAAIEGLRRVLRG